MIYSVIMIIGCIMLVPFGLGTLFHQFVHTQEILKNRVFLTRVLDTYVEGLLMEFFLFECVGHFFVQIDASYTNFVNRMAIFIVVLMLVSLGFIIWTVYCRRRIVSRGIDHIHILSKRSQVICVFIILYIILTSCFVLPNAADETIVRIIVMKKNDVIGIFSLYNELYMGDYSGHTRLIELFYGTLADFTRVGLTQFVQFIMSGCLLLFFFGIYKRIESIFVLYTPIIGAYKKQIEQIFAVLLVTWIFIDGSMYYAVAQNIWNGDTLLGSCIIPLEFTYGYAAICEASQAAGRKTIGWLCRMALLIPVAGMMSDIGAYIAICLMVVAFGTIFFGMIKKLIQKG